ncbi:hypothetical protein V2G26_014535 [Clonostachys chloroleuca]
MGIMQLGIPSVFQHMHFMHQSQPCLWRASDVRAICTMRERQVLEYEDFEKAIGEAKHHSANISWYTVGVLIPNSMQYLASLPSYMRSQPYLGRTVHSLNDSAHHSKAAKKKNFQHLNQKSQ